MMENANPYNNCFVLMITICNIFIEKEMLVSSLNCTMCSTRRDNLKVNN